MTSSPLSSAMLGTRFQESSAPLDGVEIRLLQLPVRETLAASHGSHEIRQLTVVRLSSSRHGESMTGWGECAALPTASYWPETAASSYSALRQAMASLLGRSPQELLTLVQADQSEPSLMSRLPMVRAALEMAVLDLVLTSAGLPLSQVLGSTTEAVPAGATVGLGPPLAVAVRAQDLAAEGFVRIKVKIEPDHDVAVVRAIMERVGSAVRQGLLLLQVDANGSYRPEPEAAQTLLNLAELGVQVIEQPYPPSQPDAARELCDAIERNGLATRVLADEAAAGVAEAVSVVKVGAAHGVVIKPSRLGGLSPALRLLDRAIADGFPISIGGMLESGLGRHALACFAAIAHDSAQVLPGDLAPARRWLADDPWPDLTLASRSGRIEVAVPRNPGVAPAPDLALLDRYTVRQASVP